MIAKLDKNNNLILVNKKRMVVDGYLIINGTDEMFREHGFVDVVESIPAQKDGYVANPEYKYNKDKTLILQKWTYEKIEPVIEPVTEPVIEPIIESDLQDIGESINE